MNEYVISQTGNFYEVDFVAHGRHLTQKKEEAKAEAKKLRMACQIESLLRRL